jgi:hypothetical protein
MRSAIQRFVCLSVTEAETAAGVTITQDMLYVFRIITSLGLKANLAMTLWMDNKGAVDLATSWSVGGHTHHVDVRMHFLREMKDQGLLQMKHLPGDDNPAISSQRILLQPYSRDICPSIVARTNTLVKTSELRRVLEVKTRWFHQVSSIFSATFFERTHLAKTVLFCSVQRSHNL